MLEQFKATLELNEDSGGVTVRVMPYGHTITHNGQEIQFDAGSLDAVEGVPLTVDHGANVTDVIGVVDGYADSDTELIATAQFAKTQLGQETKELLAIGAVADVSAGVRIDSEKEYTDDNGVLHRFGALDHVAVVVRGAFGKAGAGSKVLAVHSTDEGDIVEQEKVAPPVEPEVQYAEASEVEVLRAEVAKLSLPGTFKARPTEYKGFGEILVDTIAHARQTNPEATERLTSLMDAGAITPDGKGLSLATEQYAFPNPGSVGNSIGSGVAYDAYIPDLLRLLRQGRPTVDLMSKRQLPAEGNRVFMPAVSVGNIVGYQDGQGTLLANQRQDQILTDVPKATIGGGQGVTIQAQLWTNPSYMSSVAEDLTAAYAEFQNDKAVNGDPAVDTPTSATGYTGIMEVVGTTDVPVGGAPLAAIPLLGTAWAAVWTGTRRAPTHALMSAAMWGALLNEVDTDGRPIIQNIAPSNPVGTGDAGSPAGTLRGLTVVIDDSVGDTDIVVTNMRDTLMFEDSGSPAQLRLTYPDVLVTDISIFGFSALFIRRPAAYAILSGITIP